MTMVRFCLQFVIFNELWLKDACVIIKQWIHDVVLRAGASILSIQVLRHLSI